MAETETTTDPVVEDKEIIETKTEPKAPAAKKPVIRDHDDAILKLREENEKLRKTLEQASEEKATKMAEERITQAKNEAREDAQKLMDAKLAEMEERGKQRIVRAELRGAAQKAGVVDFDDLYEIMRRDLKIEFDPDGNVLNAGDLIAAIKKTKPHLFGQVSTSSTTTAPPAREHVIEKSALTLSKEDYKKARAQLLNT